LNYDFLMIALVRKAYQMLGRLLEPYFDESTEELRSKLISGMTGNVTMETNKHLWDLAQKAKASPTVTDLLRRYGEEEARKQLEQTPEGQAFLDALERFLSEYGHREIRMDILYPTWVEDPSPVLGFLRGYLDADKAQSPHQQQTSRRRQGAEPTSAANAPSRGASGTDRGGAVAGGAGPPGSLPGLADLPLAAEAHPGPHAGKRHDALRANADVPTLPPAAPGVGPALE